MLTLRNVLSWLVIMATSTVAFAQNDVIMLRNGVEMEVTVELVDNNEVSYRTSRKEPPRSIGIKEVYMIKFAQRGNVYVTAEGKRVTGENQKIDKDADIVYLTSGKELPAYHLKINDQFVTFLTAKPKNKKNIPIATTFSRDEVFMVKYKDGTKDKLTDITIKDEVVEPTEPPVEVKESQEPEVVETEQVIFHSVAKGDTLSSIAKRYGVSASQIIEWNDLPSKLRLNSRLQDDMQLMIYVKSTN